MVRLAGTRVVAVGGGRVAAAKLAPLLAAGADLRLIAPHAVPELAQRAAAGELDWQRRRYAGRADLDAAVLVVAATAAADVNERVAADAAALATLCVRVDRQPDAAHPGTATFAGAVRHGALTIAVSTDGQAPSLARRLRQELDASYGPEYGELVALLAELRRDPQLRAHLARLSDSQRRAAWRRIPVPDILTLIRRGASHTAKEVAAACLSSSSD